MRTLLTADRLLLGSALLALVGGAVAMLAGAPEIAHLVWAAGILPVLGHLLVSSARSLVQGDTGVDLIAALAMGGALILGEHLAGIVIALMYAGGTVLEEFAQRRAHRELAALLSRTPRVAHREHADRLEEVAVEAVAPGDRLVVKSGEVLPVDGVVLGEAATLDEAALTGEPLPVHHPAGDRVLSGTVNAGPPFRLQATASADASTYAGIVRLVEAAQAQKAPFIRLADRYAMVFLPVTLAIAGAAWLVSGDPVRALAVLVVATPCPLILAAPVAIVSGISAAAARGILFKGGAALEALARVRTVLFDKTGTLTTGEARLIGIETRADFGADEVLRLAASLDQVSPHILAHSIVAAARARGLPLELPTEVDEAHGAGIEGRLERGLVRLGGDRYVLGRQAGAWAQKIDARAEIDGASAVFVSLDRQPVGALILADEIRAETPRVLRMLRQLGIERLVMVSGDRLDVAEAVAAAVGIDSVLAERSPADKVDAVRAERADGPLAMVGDGINDAPALAAADVGVAMGARGGSAASEAGDVVLLVDRLDRLVEAIRIARRSRGIALQSVLVGIGLSILGMLGAAAGLLTPVAGALVQEGIDIVVILNALRALRTGRRLPPDLGLTRDELSAIRAEHGEVEGLLDELRRSADALGGTGPQPGLGELRSLKDRLVEQLLHHERSDELELHPRLEPAMGGTDPFAAISRTHREIVHLIRRFDRLVLALGAEHPDEDEVVELRRVLYSLEAIARLHLAQEEEIYEGIEARTGSGRRPRAPWGTLWRRRQA